MKIEKYINDECKKYKNKVVKAKQKGINLDNLEKDMSLHLDRCKKFIGTQINSCEQYSEYCNMVKLAEQQLQNVDDEVFGCFNDHGQCLGYNFYK